VRSRYRLRLLVTDRPGVLAAISRVLAEHQVSIASVFQQEAPDEHEGDAVPLAITTHTVPADTLRAALADIDRLDCVRAPSVVSPVG
jgi:homoserine dehydrogenase